MTMASGLYAVTITGTMNASDLVVNLALATNKVILVTDSYTPAFDTHNDYGDITNEHAASGTYVQNNKQVGGTPTFAVTGSGATTAGKYDWSAAVEWTSSTITAEGMVITTAVATGLLICAVDFGQPYSSTNGTFSIDAHANGIFYIDLVP